MSMCAFPRVFKTTNSNRQYVKLFRSAGVEQILVECGLWMD